MKYYLKDSFLHNAHEKNAGSKARNDVEAILISEGYEGLELKVENWYKMNFFKAQQHKYRATKSVFDQLGADETEQIFYSGKVAYAVFARILHV